MSIDIFADLIIGYPIDLDQFKVTLPEKSHMEDRWDPKTGEKLAGPVKVIDEEEREAFKFEGIEEEDELDFAQKLEEKLNVCVSGHGTWGDREWYISVPIDPTSVEDVQKALDGVEEFKKLIKKSGIKVGKFEVDIKVGTSE